MRALAGIRRALTPTVPRVRLALVAVGLLLCAAGGLFLLQDVSPRRWLGILLWLALAVVLHDGVLSPILVAIGLAAAPQARRLGRRTVAALQALLVVGAVLSSMGLVGALAAARGSANPTIVTAPYLLSLGVVWAVLGVVAAALLVPALRRARTK